MTTVYFVRHAQTDYSNPVDKERVLTKEGLKDRYKVIDFFEREGNRDRIFAVYASDYRRAVDTVKPLADTLGLPVIEMTDFRERKVDETDEDYFAVCKRMWENLDYKLEGGECIHEVQKRNLRGLHQLLQQHPGEIVVVGSHGMALSSLINFYNPAFVYDDFVRIIDIKPWIVEFQFEGEQLLSYRERELLS